MGTLRSWRADLAGQAGVEHLAVVVIVAVLLGGIGVWVGVHLRPGPATPPVVERVWTGLDRIPEPSPPVPDLGLRPGRGEGIRRMQLRRLLRSARDASRMVVAGPRAFATGFGEGLWTAVTEFVRDPVGLLTDGGGLVTAIVRDPAGFAAAQLAAAVSYAAELRAMPPGDAYRRLMHDLGGASADAVVARGKGLAHRAMLRELKRRLDARTAAPGQEPQTRDRD